MNKKIVLLAIVATGLIFGGRYTYAQGTNCDDPKLASDNCIVKFESSFVKRGVIRMLAEYGVIEVEDAENPDTNIDITVGQLRGGTYRAHLNLIPDDEEEQNYYIKQALKGEKISLKGMEYVDGNIGGIYAHTMPITDFSPLVNAGLDLTRLDWLEWNLAMFRDVKLNEYGVFKNPIVGIDGKTLPFGNLKNPEKQVQELAKNGLEPILVQDVNEKGEPDRNGGYLKLLNNPYILSYEKAIEYTYENGHEQRYGNIENLTYENGMSLIGISIAKDEIQPVENKQGDKLKNENVKAPNTGVSNRDSIIWLMGSVVSLLTVSYLVKRY